MSNDAIQFAHALYEFRDAVCWLRTRQRELSKAMGSHRGFARCVQPDQESVRQISELTMYVEQAWTEVQKCWELVKVTAFAPPVSLGGVEPRQYLRDILCDVDELAKLVGGPLAAPANVILSEEQEKRYTELRKRLMVRIHGLRNLLDHNPAVGASTGDILQQAREAAEDYCARNPYPSARTLAMILGYTPGTIQHAIKESAKLQEARVRARECKSQRKRAITVAMPEPMVVRAKRRGKVNRAEAAARNEMLNRLRQQIAQEERVKINGMTLKQRRELAALIAADPYYSHLNAPR